MTPSPSSISPDSEAFVPISGFPKYEINQLGQIRSTRTGKILQTQRNSTGGAMVKIVNSRGYESTCMIARTVYQTFRDQLNRYQYIQFHDKNPANCRLSNLTVKSMPEIRRKHETPA